mgnify:CR=1 FL=1
MQWFIWGHEWGEPPLKGILQEKQKVAIKTEVTERQGRERRDCAGPWAARPCPKPPAGRAQLRGNASPSLGCSSPPSLPPLLPPSLMYDVRAG